MSKYAEGPGRRMAGRRVIFSGAACGIGKAIAQLFHAKGAQLSLFDLNADALDAVVTESRFRNS
jgi:NAD(P)-dependent dehydrogenase (short-subunit alcohol dehydrogenase family)